jgi:hypothetical protein
MNRIDTATLIAGVLAGIAGLLAFLVLHALSIVPKLMPSFGQL